MLRMNEHDPYRTSIQHRNIFTMINTRSFELGTYHYVLPSQCGHVFYSEVPGRRGWSFFVRYDKRARDIKYNIVEEDDIDDDIIENHSDDNDDMANPFNFDSELDDMLDEELDK